jgi:hypothetical protein
MSNGFPFGLIKALSPAMSIWVTVGMAAAELLAGVLGFFPCEKTGSATVNMKTAQSAAFAKKTSLLDIKVCY